MMLSDVCLSVAYIGPKSRTERVRKTKTGTEVAHVTPDLDTTFKVKMSKVKVTGGGGILWRHPAQLVQRRTTIIGILSRIREYLALPGAVCVSLNDKRWHHCAPQYKSQGHREKEAPKCCRDYLPAERVDLSLQL